MLIIVPGYLCVVFKGNHKIMDSLFLGDFQSCILGKVFVRSHPMKYADRQPHPLCYDRVQEALA